MQELVRSSAADREDRRASAGRNCLFNMDSHSEKQTMDSTLQLIELLGADAEAVRAVHMHSLDLLQGTGVKFYSARAREIWHGHGAQIRGDVVRIPGNLVEAALESAPASFTLYSRDGKHDLVVGTTETFFSQDGCAAHTLDFETGERRASNKVDIAKMALISDSLDVIDIVSPTVSAQDVPAAGTAVHELEACLVNSGKHVLTESVTSARDARGQIELAGAVAGGGEELRARPIISNFVCTISPLIQDEGGIEAALEFAAAGVPVGMYPMATTGVTAPVTLMGTLAVLNAEVVSGLALLQLAQPGAKVFYSGGPATIDLRTGAYTAASPEALWLRMMVARMARFYRIPSIVGAGATSAKLPGAQAAWENSLSFLLPTMAGASVLFGMGLLDGSNLLTYESILLDAEMGAMVKRLVQRVEPTDEAFAIDLVHEMGPGGVYLDQAHTVRQMRKALSVPSLSDRDSYEEWHKKGARDPVQAACERVREILATHHPPPLAEDVRREMDEIIETYSRQQAWHGTDR
jgi:trimethylamine--corrinoid protein Co-methyltransferase